MQKTKKQHYVPQSYLKAWAIPGTYQVHVYDKKTDNERVNSINDIASENCFYDINPNEIFSKEFLAALKVEGLSWDSDELSQDNRKLLFYIRRQKGHAFRLSCNSIYTNKASQESYYRFCRLFSPGIERYGSIG